MRSITCQSEGAAATEKIGETLGTRVQGGECIELVSDVGGGKTTFVRGLARGMGSEDHVSSPTFTVSKQYQAYDLTLFHFDFYRLHDGGMVRHELSEAIGKPSSVVVIEWSDIVRDVLPAARLRITFKPEGENERSLAVEYPKELTYMVQDLC